MPEDAHSPVAAADSTDGSHYRLWQRRFYPFNVFSEKKRQEKLNYMHNNPVQRGLVSAPGDWPWSSWRFLLLAGRLNPPYGPVGLSSEF